MVIKAFRQVGLEDFGEYIEDELSSYYRITVCNYGSRTVKTHKLCCQGHVAICLKPLQLLQLQLAGSKSLVHLRSQLCK